MGQGHVNQIFRLYAFSWNWFVKFSYWVVGSPNSVFRSINILTSFKNLMYWFFKKLNSPFTPCISLCLNWSLLIMTFLCYLCSLVGKSNFSTIIICLVIFVISVLRDSSYTRKLLKLTKFEKKKKFERLQIISQLGLWFFVCLLILILCFAYLLRYANFRAKV